MLEFAYTGEVNVAQDLLPSLLHTARAFRIKGLDKVESPIEAPPPPPTQDATTAAAAAVAAAAAAAAAAVRQNSSESHHWGAQSSAPNTRPHSPSSIHSDVKPSFVSAEHFMATPESKPLVQPPAAHSNPASHLPTAAVAAANAAAFPLQAGGVKRGRERELSPPPTMSGVSGSRPPTRESSPCPQSAAAAARTPPPKRWKKSFDMAQPTSANGQPKENGDQLSMVVCRLFSVAILTGAMTCSCLFDFAGRRKLFIPSRPLRV
jgi:hypothetical protein